MTTNAPDTRQGVMRATIDELAAMLSADGAALDIVSIDEASVELRVTLDDLDCEDCVLPPAQLRTTIAAALARDTGAAIAVVLHDPRAVEAVTGGTTIGTSGPFVVLDPTGVAPDDGVPDPGPDAGPIAGKTVAIRHDVLWPAFDWTV